MSSKLSVKVVSISKIEPHPNADRLEFAAVGGWNCVVSKGAFKEGDKGVYIPIDSVLPPEIEEMIFGPESKIKLTKSRVKTIKIRGQISQGLLVKLDTVGLDSNLLIDTDVTSKLRIEKYEPPVRQQQNLMGGSVAKKKKNTNVNFKKYSSFSNVKNCMNMFREGEMVTVTEKIHGTNFRAGYVPSDANTLWKKIRKAFGFLPKYEFVYGSHNVQLQDSINMNSTSTNVYLEAVNRDKLDKILGPGEVVYGEIFGSGVQKNYLYGCADGERKTVYFDIMKNGLYEDPDSARAFFVRKRLPMVQELYRGPFSFSRIKELLKGNSVMFPTQKIIEGGVCESLETNSNVCRRITKFINDEYLLKDNSDFH